MRDFDSYLQSLENILIDLLADADIQAVAKIIDSVDEQDNKISDTGVWVGKKKIAFIGVAVKKCVTYHRSVLNIKQEPIAFQGLRPCCFSVSIKTSFEAMTEDL